MRPPAFEREFKLIFVGGPPDQTVRTKRGYLTSPNTVVQPVKADDGVIELHAYERDALGLCQWQGFEIGASERATTGADYRPNRTDYHRFLEESTRGVREAQLEAFMRDFRLLMDRHPDVRFQDDRDDNAFFGVPAFEHDYWPTVRCESHEWF